jgi:hypothetical protein
MAKRYTRNKRRRKTRKLMKGGIDLNDTIPHDENDSHYLDMDDSFQSNGSLHLSDLDNESGYQNTLINEPMDLDAIPQAEDDSHYLDMDESNGSLHLSDLDTSVLHESGYTTGPDDESFGGKRRRKSSKKRRGKKGRKTRKNRRKQKGGVCYGNGVGANSYDPNYSIYNTNMLKLFPYKS